MLSFSDAAALLDSWGVGHPLGAPGPWAQWCWARRWAGGAVTARPSGMSYLLNIRASERFRSLKLRPCIPTWTCTWLPEQAFSAVITPSSILDFARGKNEELWSQNMYIYMFAEWSIAHSRVTLYCFILPETREYRKIFLQFFAHIFFLLYLPRWLLTLEFFESSYLDFFWRKSHICT